MYLLYASCVQYFWLATGTEASDKNNRWQVLNERRVGGVMGQEHGCGSVS